MEGKAKQIGLVDNILELKGGMITARKMGLERKLLGDWLWSTNKRRNYKSQF